MDSGEAGDQDKFNISHSYVIVIAMLIFFFGYLEFSVHSHGYEEKIPVYFKNLAEIHEIFYISNCTHCSSHCTHCLLHFTHCLSHCTQCSSHFTHCRVHLILER